MDGASGRWFTIERGEEEVTCCAREAKVLAIKLSVNGVLLKVHLYQCPSSRIVSIKHLVVVVETPLRECQALLIGDLLEDGCTRRRLLLQTVSKNGTCFLFKVANVFVSLVANGLQEPPLCTDA